MKLLYIKLNIIWPYKEKEILLFATIWMDLEGITLSDVSQAEKDKYHMTSNKLIPTEDRLTVTRGNNDKMHEGEQKIQIYRYKISQSYLELTILYCRFDSC